MTSKKSLSKSYIKIIIRNHRTILLVMAIAILAFNMLAFYIHDTASNEYYSSYSNPYSISVLVSVGITGLFIIPLVLSCVLFNYVYKAEKLDLIGSLPMSRKRIYLTNILFGIGYIICIFAANLLIILGYAALKGSNLCSVPLIFDANLVLCISYIVVFGACSLAACVSGNTITQIVVCILVLTIIPFFRIVTMTIDYSCDEYQLVLNSQTIDLSRNAIKVDSLGYFTYPYYLIAGSLVDSYLPIVNVKSIVYSIAASTIYFVAGYYMYAHRKMENVGTSFKDDRVHAFVKALTMLPMILYVYIILTGLDEESSVVIPIVIRALIPITIYYFVYDVVLRKKIKLKNNLAYYIISVGAIYLLFTVLYTPKIERYNNNNATKVYAEDIAYIEVQKNNEFLLSNRSYFDWSGFEDYKVIKDEKTISSVLKDISGESVYNTDSYDLQIDEIPTYNPSVNVRFHIKGKTLESHVSINKELYEKLYPEEERISDAVKEFRISGDTLYTIYDSDFGGGFTYRKADNEFKKVLNENIENVIKNKNGINDDNAYDSNTMIFVATYDNHMCKMYRLNLLADKNILNYVANEIMNKDYSEVKSINSVLKIEKNDGDEIISYDGDVNNPSFYDKMDVAIKNGINAGFDSSKEFYYIVLEYYDRNEKNVHNSRRNMMVLVNNIDEINYVYNDYGGLKEGDMEDYYVYKQESNPNQFSH